MKKGSGRERLLVVGGGMAGMAAVEEILKLDPKRYEITVLGAEKHPNYNRILLAQVLRGEKTIEDLYMHGPGWFEASGIRLVTGVRAVELRRRGRTVVGSDKEEYGYDRLILATGSLPVLPPVPGMDKDGVVSFRDINDCERIKGHLGSDPSARKVAVIGGGLLGLEAAYSISALGAKVTVVHLADRLMERQLDTVASGYLAEDLKKGGVDTLLNAKTVEITGNGKAEGVRCEDGRGIEADLVVVSVGIRPNAELARASGIYCERGIVVSDVMQTYDPSVYAVGECVEHRGATFGLVASVFEQARVLASHLAGDARLVFAPRPSPVRLKVPGIDLYSAGAVDGGAEVESIEYHDRGERVYKRLFVSGKSLSGVVLYGDTSGGPELFDLMAGGADISGKRARLLMAGVGGAESVDEMPDEAVVCGCNGVTKKMIVDAVEGKGLLTREEVGRETGASTSCGGCSGLVERIIEKVLGSSFSPGGKAAGICECTKYGRDDIIKNIRERGLKSVEEVMATLGWESVGCEVCRPAINYYVSMVWPTGSVDDPSSRLINERVHANIQKDGTFSVVPRVPGGVIRPDELRRLADAADKYDLPLVKITGGQRIGLYGVKREDLPGVWKDVGMPSGHAYGKALRTVKTCVGARFCRYGTQDSMGLGVEMEERLAGLWTPAKVKLGVSGCPRDCAESGVKDVGIKGIAGGFAVYVGGCGGIELAGAEPLATVKTAEEARDIVYAFIQHYREDAEYGERTFRWVKRRGLKAVRKAVVENAESRIGLLKRLDEALANATDPWISGSGEEGARAVGH